MTEPALTVDLGERSYPLYIDSQIISSESLYRKHISGRNVLIVTDENTAPHYLPALQETLSGFNCNRLVLPPGESQKTLDTVASIYDQLMRDRFDRNSTLIALGGGVVGDICGFAAATYQRGVRFVQVPTTLLAQVDSSVGGKTGVNHPLGKNMIGAFHQPACVIADMDTLTTLPARELKAGLAEVIKYGLIDDAEFFQWVDKNLSGLLSLEATSLRQAVAHCCENKARIVASDEREKGKRALLNLGHTFGHAIENACGYGVWLHGEAIAAGMCLAAQFSIALGQLPEPDLAIIKSVFQRADLPVQPPAEMTAQDCLNLMSRDKKVKDNILTLVLMKGIGRAFLSTDYDRSILEHTLDSAFSGAAGCLSENE
ncbi:3-dehydroquinate synthase [Chromatiales bacterium (ex Bugula neritina AB1)]|nr:3-dehydroquinate synthase [Chromatiales bacterium (ex Bugula neritina AB1)]